MLDVCHNSFRRANRCPLYCVRNYRDFLLDKHGQTIYRSKARLKRFPTAKKPRGKSGSLALHGRIDIFPGHKKLMLDTKLRAGARYIYESVYVYTLGARIQGI